MFFKPSTEAGNSKRGLLTIVKEGIKCCQVKTRDLTIGVVALAISFQHMKRQIASVKIFVPGNVLRTEGA